MPNNKLSYANYALNIILLSLEMVSRLHSNNNMIISSQKKWINIPISLTKVSYYLLLQEHNVNMYA